MRKDENARPRKGETGKAVDHINGIDRPPLSNQVPVPCL
jgi:hypothetical protein